MAKISADVACGICSCGKIAVYNDKFDAAFCVQCDKWIEPVCGNRDCIFCAERPEKPSQTDE